MNKMTTLTSQQQIDALINRLVPPDFKNGIMDYDIKGNLITNADVEAANKYKVKNDK